LAVDVGLSFNQVLQHCVATVDLSCGAFFYYAIALWQPLAGLTVSLGTAGALDITALWVHHLLIFKGAAETSSERSFEQLQVQFLLL
jgi:hypothetical protein